MSERNDAIEAWLEAIEGNFDLILARIDSDKPLSTAEKSTSQTF